MVEKRGTDDQYALGITEGFRYQTRHVPKFVAAIENTGRKNLIMAGVRSDVCLAFAGMQAVDAGYNVYGVEPLTRLRL